MVLVVSNYTEIEFSSMHLNSMTRGKCLNNSTLQRCKSLSVICRESVLFKFLDKNKTINLKVQ
jgi:hypothetical protein